MAILSKIRNHSIFLIIIIGLALFSFVLSGIFKPNGSIFGGNVNSVGEINGENIGREEFAQLVEQIRARSGNRASMIQSVNAAWDNLVRDKIYQSQLQKSGIVVGEKDVWDEIVNQLASQGNPQFMNEAGMFDPEKFKDYIASLKDNQDAGEQDKLAWLSWLNYERSVKSNMEIQTYNNLINAGLNATLKEGERYYTNANTKLNIDYVFVPYNSIPDSLVTVSDDEIKDYVKQHPDEYKAEPSIDISFVKFDIKATPDDEAAIEKQLAGLINNKEEYSTAAKSTITVEGLASTKNIEDFFRENSSDTPLDNEYHFKKDLNKDVADTIFKMDIGQVYGPYKDGDYFKITRLMDVKQMPDSVKSRHIIVPFAGAVRSNSTKTKEEAKKTIDSIFDILKNNKSKFAQIADEINVDGTKGKGGDIGWVNNNMAFSSQFDRNFADYIFYHKIGDIGIVESAFGYHIIDIENQKNSQKAVKLATFTRKITASEETENTIYQKAETFASELSNGKDITDLAKESGLTVQPVVGLKAMDERVSTLGDQRPIVTWGFENATKENDIKRFDVQNGYAVVQLTGKRKKGLSIGSSKTAIRATLANEKKAKLIEQKMKAGNTLEEIAKNFDLKVASSKAVSISSPVLPGVGRSDDLITTIVDLPVNKLYRDIETRTGVFAVKILEKKVPEPLENYSGSMNVIHKNLVSKSRRSYETLKNLADIVDNRSAFY